MVWKLSLVVMAAALGQAAAEPEGETLLRDGVQLRRLVRLGGSVASGLAAVRWSDAATGRGVTAGIGRRAIVTLGAGADAKTTLAALGVRPVRPLMPTLGMWLVESELPTEDGLVLADRLQRHREFGRAIRQALPDLFLVHRHHDLMLPPDDPRYSGQWFFQRIAMEDAWRIESGSASVTIVVIDNGCDLAHPDLVAKLDPGKDVIDGDSDPSFLANLIGNHHGTACAGLAAASTGNGLGVAGACPGCRVRCVRLLSDDPKELIPLSADVDAFQFVLDSGAAVASNSWGFVSAMPVPQPLADAIQNVHDNGRGGLGTLVVFAAGNEKRLLGADELEALPGVTTVGAVDNFNEQAQFSNYGPPLAVVAPLGTLTTDISGADGADPGDYTSSFGGTSSACPIVAGIFGLMVSAAPDRKATELEMILRSTAKQSIFATPDAQGHDDSYGFGLVQPAAALRVLKPSVADMTLPMEPPAPMNPSGGCACRAGARPPATPGWALLLGASLWLALRRRARSKRSAPR